MTVWLDAHLSPAVARWLTQNYGVTALPVRAIGLRAAEDEEIFFAARAAADVVISKDKDFVTLLEKHGSPPKIIWLTCGNTSDVALRQILTARFQESLPRLNSGEDLVEINSL